jgi:hypothetical protein
MEAKVAPLESPAARLLDVAVVVDPERQGRTAVDHFGEFGDVNPPGCRPLPDLEQRRACDYLHPGASGQKLRKGATYICATAHVHGGDLPFGILGKAISIGLGVLAPHCIGEASVQLADPILGNHEVGHTQFSSFAMKQHSIYPPAPANATNFTGDAQLQFIAVLG